MTAVTTAVPHLRFFFKRNKVLSLLSSVTSLPVRAKRLLQRYVPQRGSSRLVFFTGSIIT
jgi:hypothetical protein